MDKKKSKIIVEPEGIIFLVENKKLTPEDEKLLEEYILNGRKKRKNKTLIKKIKVGFI